MESEADLLALGSRLLRLLLLIASEAPLTADDREELRDELASYVQTWVKNASSTAPRHFYATHIARASLWFASLNPHGSLIVSAISKNAETHHHGVYRPLTPPAVVLALLERCGCTPADCRESCFILHERIASYAASLHRVPEELGCFALDTQDIRRELIAGGYDQDDILLRAQAVTDAYEVYLTAHDELEEEKVS